MTRGMSASELVIMLDSVFCAFDKLADRRQLEKIKTVGDCYILAANLLRHPPRPPVTCVEAALETFKVLGFCVCAAGSWHPVPTPPFPRTKL